MIEFDLGVVLKTFSSSVIKNLFSKSAILRSLSDKPLLSLNYFTVKT